MVQYLMHKIGIALFSGMLFLANWAFMISNYRNYAVYLVLAYGLTALISFGLILLAASPKSHRLIIRLVSFFNRSGKLDKVLKKLEESCEILETSAVALLKDKKLIFSSILKELLRNCFWYCIPFIIMLGTGMITLWQSFAVTSLAVMTAAVIPTPAGIGALELIMTSLFGIIAGVDMGGAITLLYRFATFIFPFFVGGVYLLITRSGKRQILNSDRIEAPALEKERS